MELGEVLPSGCGRFMLRMSAANRLRDYMVLSRRLVEIVEFFCFAVTCLKCEMLTLLT